MNPDPTSAPHWCAVRHLLVHAKAREILFAAVVDRSRNKDHYLAVRSIKVRVAGRRLLIREYRVVDRELVDQRAGHCLIRKISWVRLSVQDLNARAVRRRPSNAVGIRLGVDESRWSRR